MKPSQASRKRNWLHRDGRLDQYVYQANCAKKHPYTSTIPCDPGAEPIKIHAATCWCGNEVNLKLIGKLP